MHVLISQMRGIMIINVMKLKSKPLRGVLASTMNQAFDKNNYPRTDKLDVRLTVNGIEMDLDSVFDRWENNYKASKMEIGKEFVEEKLGEMYRKIEELESNIDAILAELDERDYE